MKSQNQKKSTIGRYSLPPKTDRVSSSYQNTPQNSFQGGTIVPGSKKQSLLKKSNFPSINNSTGKKITSKSHIIQSDKIQELLQQIQPSQTGKIQTENTDRILSFQEYKQQNLENINKTDRTISRKQSSAAIQNSYLNQENLVNQEYQLQNNNNKQQEFMNIQDNNITDQNNNNEQQLQNINNNNEQNVQTESNNNNNVSNQETHQRIYRNSMNLNLPQNINSQSNINNNNNDSNTKNLMTQMSTISPRLQTSQRFNTTSGNWFSSLNKTNNYTFKDSRHNQIEWLQKENIKLKLIVKDLRQDLNSIDEFRIAMEKNKQLQNFQEKRIELLKAQISKQQRYIKKMTTMVNTSKKSSKEMNHFLNFLIDNTQEENNGNTFQSIAKEQETGSKTEDQILQKLDTISNAAALKQIQVVQNEDRFQQNFNNIYSKILDYQKQNVEFSQLFKITAVNGKKKVKFLHPIKTFLKQYGHNFPVYTIFDAFPSQQHECFSNMLTAIRGMMRETFKGFQKIQNFDLFKGNPFYFKQQGAIDLPEVLMEQTADFQQFMAKRDQFKTITLDYKAVSQTESCLAKLMETLLKFQSNITSQQMHELDIDGSTQDMIQQLRSCSEQLICLGVLISCDYSTTNSKILLLTQETRNLAKQNKLEDQEGLHKQIKEQRKKQQEQNTIYDGIVLDADSECNNEFIEKFRLITQYQEDLSKNIFFKEFEDAQMNLNRIGMVGQQMKNIHEMKNNLLLIKDTEIQFLKNQLELYQYDNRFCRDFVLEMQICNKNFFSSIKKSILQIHDTFSQLFEQNRLNDNKTRKEFVLLFKTNLKQVTQKIDRILTKEPNSNELNIKDVQSSFFNKVKLMKQKTDQLKKRVQREEKQQHDQEMQHDHENSHNNNNNNHSSHNQSSQKSQQ